MCSFFGIFSNLCFPVKSWIVLSKTVNTPCFVVRGIWQRGWEISGFLYLVMFNKNWPLVKHKPTEMSMCVMV